MLQQWGDFSSNFDSCAECF